MTSALLWNTVLLWLSVALVVMSFGYGIAMYLMSRRAVEPVPPNSGDRFYIFMMACLNEEKVLPGSLARLMSMERDDFAVLVIDDASDDSTAEIAAQSDPARVRLHRRHPPNARRGKGAALNDGLRSLADSGLLDGRSPSDVVVCVLDADGRLDPAAVSEVDRYFADPGLGAVQIGVRMYNRQANLLARLQDVEFVAYNDVFQAARRHIGTVGMGGNGQFMRLTALRDLGEEPWTDCLTEDLHMGLRLIAYGWRTENCPTTDVQQQAVLTFRRLIRQRSRWFQGHVQTSRLVPLILRTVRGKASADLLFHLSSPAVLLLASLLPIAFLFSLAGIATSSYAAGHSTFQLAWLAPLYVLAFGPSYAYAHVYRRREPSLGTFRALAVSHAFVLYGYIWFFSGWWAIGRMLVRRSGWLKTART